MRRGIYIVCGVISIVLAIVGIIVPGLPTTPFVLLAVWLFTHSSPSILRILMGNRMLSNYVTNYRERGGLSVRSKVSALVFMWVMVLLSVVLQVDNILIRCIIIGVALIGSYVMGVVVPTAKK